MNPFAECEILTVYAVNQPLDQFLEEMWFDSNMREWDFPGVPLHTIDALGLSKRPESNQRRQQIDFDIQWTHRVCSTNSTTFPTVLWSPSSCPGCTAIITNWKQAEPDLLGPSTPHRDWKVLWTFIDDGDPENSVCWLQYTGPRERPFREVWCGLNDESKSPKWQFNTSGPVQSFEEPVFYKLRRIRERLTRPIVADCFRRFGCDIRPCEFWTSNTPGWVIWNDINGKFPDLQSLPLNPGRC